MENTTKQYLNDATPIHYVAITGTDSGDCSSPGSACRTIRYAVDQAGEKDEVRVAGGTYTDVHAGPAPAGYVGSAFITQVVYISKSSTIQGGYTTTDWSTSQPISYPTILTSLEQGRVFFIAGRVTVTFGCGAFVPHSAVHEKHGLTHSPDTDFHWYVIGLDAVNVTPDHDYPPL